MLTQRYFISTGAKAAMFTLWVKRYSGDAVVDNFLPARYIHNLAACENEEAAIAKAKEQVEAIRQRIECDTLKVEFAGVWDEPCNVRRGKLSVRDTQALETIEAGYFPFGKHGGTKLADAPANYVLYWADQLPTASNLVTATLAAACQGVALELGYIAKRDADRADRAAADALSGFIGTVGERRDFTGEVVTSFFKRDEYSAAGGYYINKVRVGTDLVTAIGSVKIGEVGQTVTFKATIKAHDEYKGVKTTKVNRPKVAA